MATEYIYQPNQVYATQILRLCFFFKVRPFSINRDFTPLLHPSISQSWHPSLSPSPCFAEPMVLSLAFPPFHYTFTRIISINSRNQSANHHPRLFFFFFLDLGKIRLLSPRRYCDKTLNRLPLV